MAKGTSPVFPPPDGWETQTNIGDGWAVTWLDGGSRILAVWGREVEQPGIMVLIYYNDVSNSGRRVLREDGTYLLRENGSYFQLESNTP